MNKCERKLQIDEWRRRRRFRLNAWKSLLRIHWHRTNLRKLLSVKQRVSSEFRSHNRIEKKKLNKYDGNNSTSSCCGHTSHAYIVKTRGSNDRSIVVKDVAASEAAAAATKKNHVRIISPHEMSDAWFVWTAWPTGGSHCRFTLQMNNNSIVIPTIIIELVRRRRHFCRFLCVAFALWIYSKWMFVWARSRLVFVCFLSFAEPMWCVCTNAVITINGRRQWEKREAENVLLMYFYRFPFEWARACGARAPESVWSFLLFIFFAASDWLQLIERIDNATCCFSYFLFCFP